MRHTHTHTHTHTHVHTVADRQGVEVSGWVGACVGGGGGVTCVLEHAEQCKDLSLDPLPRAGLLQCAQRSEWDAPEEKPQCGVEVEAGATDGQGLSDPVTCHHPPH